VRIWTEEDARAASVLSRIWRWRIYAMVVIAGAVVVAILVARV